MTYYFLTWRNHLSMQKLTWYFIDVCKTKSIISIIYYHFNVCAFCSDHMLRSWANFYLMQQVHLWHSVFLKRNILLLETFSARNLFSALLQNQMGDFLDLWYDNHKQEKTLESQLEMGSGFEKPTKEKIKKTIITVRVGQG